MYNSCSLFLQKIERGHDEHRSMVSTIFDGHLDKGHSSTAHQLDAVELTKEQVDDKLLERKGHRASYTFCLNWLLCEIQRVLNSKLSSVCQRVLFR
jgi:hypothetical protein